MALRGEEIPCYPNLTPMVRQSLAKRELKGVWLGLIQLPTPRSLSNMWRLGSCLGFIIRLQIITGLLLTAYYTRGRDSSFEAVVRITNDCWGGWIYRMLHFRGASVAFLACYLHIGRGIIFGRFRKTGPWLSGWVLFILLIGTAFLGYVLPWGQIRFWGATVITNLVSAVPWVGGVIVEWIWGGWRVGGPTLTRFYTLHFLLPILILGLVVSHLVALHRAGSSDPVGVKRGVDKIPFHPYYVYKDWVGFSVVFLLFGAGRLGAGDFLLERDNFIEAEPLVTPAHIKPEWYFLFAYAILRSVPNKLGGVLSLVLAVLVLPILVLRNKKEIICSWWVSHKLFCGGWGLFRLLLTFRGGEPVEEPYEGIGLWGRVGYFLSFLAVGWL